MKVILEELIFMFFCIKERLKEEFMSFCNSFFKSE